jgi:plasmid stability protein
MEAQLLTGEVRHHRITEDDERDLFDLISTSSAEMNLALGDGTAEAIDFPAARNANACRTCQFRLLCWEDST